MLDRNAGLMRHLVEAEATMEQFDLLRRYLLARHAEGGMADMTWPDYVAMVEDTAVRTHMIEYRAPSDDRGPGDLVACVLVDLLARRAVAGLQLLRPDAGQAAAWAPS